MDVSKENPLKLEHQRSFLGKYEEIIRETRGNNESIDEIDLENTLKKIHENLLIHFCLLEIIFTNIFFFLCSY